MSYSPLEANLVFLAGDIHKFEFIVYFARLGMGMNNPCCVVIGIFLRNGSVLLGRRSPTEKNFANYWEFPGGKIEVGETHEQALARELQEELGCELRTSRFLKTFETEYCGRSMQLNYYLIELCSHDPGLMNRNAHSELQWHSIEEALQVNMLPANQQILRELNTFL